VLTFGPHDGTYQAAHTRRRSRCLQLARLNCRQVPSGDAATGVRGPGRCFSLLSSDLVTRLRSPVIELSHSLRRYRFVRVPCSARCRPSNKSQTESVCFFSLFCTL